MRELLSDHVTALFVAKDGTVTRSMATAVRHGGVAVLVKHGTAEFRDAAFRMSIQALARRWTLDR